MSFLSVGVVVVIDVCIGGGGAVDEYPFGTPPRIATGQGVRSGFHGPDPASKDDALRKERIVSEDDERRRIAERDEEVPPDDDAPRVNARRVFELYVDALAGEVEAIDDLLLVRLRWLSKDAAEAVERIGSDPGAAVAVVKGLSTTVQELDAHAGQSDAMHHNLKNARRWALLLPETAIHE